MTLFVRRIIAAGVAAVALAVGPLSVPASAHDELVGTEPSAGAVLEEAPAEITLSFSGEVSDIGAEVVVTGGLDDILEGGPQVRGPDVIQAVSTDTPPGDYEVVWRVTSSDGHPISGAFDYTVDDAGIAAQEGDGAATSATGEPDEAQTTSGPETSSDGDQEAATADSDATVVDEDEENAPGTPIWVWFVLGGAILALAGVGIRAASRR